MNPLSKLDVNSSADDKEFLYSVLNLPTVATPQEIRERYRALSVIFHPDKLQDEATKDTAGKRFLELQKAYEVLSDPFTKEVYDTLGEPGLAVPWAPSLRSLPPEELRTTLLNARREVHQRKLETLIRPQHTLKATFDVTTLFEPLDSKSERWQNRLWGRVSGVKSPRLGFQTSVRKEFNKETSLALQSQVNLGVIHELGGIKLGTRGYIGAVQFAGTVRHQFSPRLSFEATSHLFDFGDRSILVRSEYRDDFNAAIIESVLSTSLLSLFPPPILISLSRKLFKESPKEANITCQLGGQPSLTLGIMSPSVFNLTTVGALSGLGRGTRYTNYAMVLSGLDSNMRVDWGITFSELALKVKASLSYGIMGSAIELTGSWANELCELATTVSLGEAGVMLKLTQVTLLLPFYQEEPFNPNTAMCSISYLEQRIVMPITLSHERDIAIGLGAVVIPSVAAVLGYHFYLKPHHRAHRVAQIRSSRQTSDEETAAMRKEAEDAISLLKDTARKRMQSEQSKEGLVITEATYGPTEAVEGLTSASLDVTIPLQVHVHSSQLYIPGHRTKRGIQGFYDPAPSIPKIIRIRYTFRGVPHYAEVPDYSPLVLPLADHACS